LRASILASKRVLKVSSFALGSLMVTVAPILGVLGGEGEALDAEGAVLAGGALLGLFEFGG
jgi:hypothetical protein